MKFDDLYNLVVEAKGTRPGDAYFRAQRNEGPQNISGQKAGITADGGTAGASSSAGYSSSPVGKVDNFEKQKPMDQMKKYLYDTSKGGSQTDTYELKAARDREMSNAFAILFNSKTFFEDFKKIYKGEGNYKGLEIDSINEVDEKEWNNALVAQQKKSGESSDARDEVNRLKEIIDGSLYGSDRIDQIKSFLQRKKTEKKNTRIKEKKEIISGEIQQAEIELSILLQDAKKLAPVQSRLQEAEKKLISAINASDAADKRFEEINSRIETKTSNNKDSNDTVLALVKSLINNKAKGLLDKLQIENKISDDEIPTGVDFLTINKKDFLYKLGLLKKLTTDDNPIFSFIDFHENRFNQGLGNFDPRTLNRNINIGVMRRVGELPAQSLQKFFFSIAGRGMERKTIPLENLDIDPGYKAAGDFIKKLEEIKSKDQWNAAVPELKKLVKNLPLSKTSKDIINSRLKGFWSITRSGANSATQLLTTVQGMLDEKTVNESFDELANAYAASFNVDINDFMIDLQEVAVFLEKSKKCDGPTKKASSDRKGKKWTKCARQPDGSYKRIHWGEAGVRVGKDNPKRRKSFRARHKCSSAKPGSPKAAACADW
jgi:hypothetical protein